MVYLTTQLNQKVWAVPLVMGVLTTACNKIFLLCNHEGNNCCSALFSYVCISVKTHARRLHLHSQRPSTDTSPAYIKASEVVTVFTTCKVRVIFNRVNLTTVRWNCKGDIQILWFFFILDKKYDRGHFTDLLHDCFRWGFKSCGVFPLFDSLQT